MADSEKTQWIESLSEEDRTFLKRFLLASGSLKELAQVYDVSYPTVRLRLDRLIEKIKVWDSHEEASGFEKAVRAQYVEGKIMLETMNLLLEAHKKDLEARD